MSASQQISCWRRVLASGMSSRISDQTLRDEQTYYYVETARSGDPAAAELTGMIVNERERRCPPKGQKSKAFYGALLMSGQVERARAEANGKDLDVDREPVDFVPLSSRPSSGAAVYWMFTGDYSELKEGAVDLSKGAHIIVYSAPGCGSCAAASEAITSDAALLRIFKQNSVWIDTPDFNFGKAYYSAWNEKFPDLNEHLIFDRSNWPPIRIPATPYFIFMKDGKVVAELIGWTKESREKLDQSLSAIGVTTTTR